MFFVLRKKHRQSQSHAGQFRLCVVYLLFLCQGYDPCQWGPSSTGEPQRGHGLNLSCVPLTNKEKQNEEWGIEKYPLLSLLSHRSFAGAFKNIWKNAAFNSENIHLLTTRTLPLNFKTLPWPKDQKGSRVNLASWFLRTFPVNWLFSSCIWLLYFFFFPVWSKERIELKCKEPLLQIFRGIYRGTLWHRSDIFFIFMTEKNKVWKKRKVTSISFPAYSPVGYN